MKLINKLLPILTIGSITAITSPLITSCSQAVFSSSDLGFKPSSQHSESKAEWSDEIIVKDYLSNSKYFVEDMAYTRLSNMNKDYKEKKDNEHYSNVEYLMNLSVGSISLSDVEKRKIVSNEGEFEAYGCRVSLTLHYDISQKYTYAYAKEELEEGVEKEVDSYSIKETFDIEISNSFVFAYYGGSEWYVGLYVDKDMDWKYTIKSSISTNWEFKVTKFSREEIVNGKNDSNNESINSRGINSSSYTEVLEDSGLGAIKSYYLEKVIPKR